MLSLGMTASVIQEASANDSKAATYVWAQGMAESLDLRGGAQTAVFPTVDEAVKAVARGGLQLLALSTVEYLSVEKQLPCRPAMVYEEAREVMHEYVLLSRNKAATLANAAGASLVIYTPNQKSSLSLVWADIRTRESGVPEGLAAFASVRQIAKKGQAAMAVFFGKADFGIESKTALATAIELNPQLGRELAVVDVSPPLLPGLVCLSDSLPRDLGRRYVEEATRLHEQVRYRQAFIVLRLTRVAEYADTYIASARALVARQRSLAAKR